MKSTLLKIFAGVLIIILVANIVLLILGRVTTRLFWMIIILTAFIAYFVIPRLRQNP